MKYPVSHRQTIDGHCDWPFRWPHERDSRSKPDRAETLGSVHESGGAGTAIAQDRVHD